MLQFTRLTLRRGARRLLEGVDWRVHRGQRVGVTGANGVGKSSVFSLILGELSADAGEFSLTPDVAIAHVAQTTPSVDRPALDYVIDGDRPLRRLEAALAHAEARAPSDGMAIAALHEQLAAIGGYDARSRAARLMAGLGFEPERQQASVASLSGGWRMRLNLAQALMCRSDLLLLDEPTNHLDLDAVLWLEAWLRGYGGALLLISHDREFLDAVCTHVAHLEQRALTVYTGNYTAFERQRAARLANQQAALEKQQREIARIESFVRRFRAKATKAKQAQSRLKALERMEHIARAHVDLPFNFTFLAPARLPTPLLDVNQVTAGYAGQPVLQDVQLSLTPGLRLGLLGRNGAGKSTLIKLLAGNLTPMAGQCRQARHLALGYFAQHQLEQLDPRASALLHLKRLDPQAREQSLRDYLGGFGFGGERLDQAAALFSGGEQARLALALLVYQRPNVLLLDEPTNHLDLDMRLALTIALQDFAGAVVLVSHDRHLLRSACDQLLLVHDGRVTAFRGDMDHYVRWLSGEHDSAQSPTVDAAPGSPTTPALRTESGVTASTRKARRRAQAQRRQQTQSLRQRVQQAEQTLADHRRRGEDLALRLSDAALYAPDRKAELNAVLREQAQVQQAVAAAEEAFLTAALALEQLERELADDR